MQWWEQHIRGPIFKQQECELYRRLSFILNQSWVGCIDRKEDSRAFFLGDTSKDYSPKVTWVQE